jgi:hypothetical protein
MPDDDEHFTEEEEFALTQADADAIPKGEEEAIDATAPDPDASISGEPYRTVLIPPPADPTVAHSSQS